MTSNLNFDTRTILQLFVIALYPVSQSLNRINKNKGGGEGEMNLHLRYFWSHIMETNLWKSLLSFANDSDHYAN